MKSHKKPSRQARHMRMTAGIALTGLLVIVMLGMERMRLAGVSINVGVTIANLSTIHTDITAKPEKRIPSTGNDSTFLMLEFRDPGTTNVRFSTGVTTQNDGTYPDLPVSLFEGTYDVAAKGFSHLRRTLPNIDVTDGVAIDFTDGGDDPLLSGDVNGDSGDNKVNGIDLTLIVGGLGDNTVRYDLNRDTAINGIDLTNAVSNLNVTGDL